MTKTPSRTLTARYAQGVKLPKRVPVKVTRTCSGQPIAIQWRSWPRATAPVSPD
jgi:hypothetical protein